MKLETTSSGRVAKRSTSFKLEYIPRASALVGRTSNISQIYPSVKYIPCASCINASKCYFASISGKRSWSPSFSSLSLLYEQSIHDNNHDQSVTLRASQARGPSREQKRTLDLSRPNPPYRLQAQVQHADGCDEDDHWSPNANPHSQCSTC